VPDARPVDREEAQVTKAAIRREDNITDGEKRGQTAGGRRELRVLRALNKLVNSWLLLVLMLLLFLPLLLLLLLLLKCDALALASLALLGWGLRWAGAVAALELKLQLV